MITDDPSILEQDIASDEDAVQRLAKGATSQQQLKEKVWGAFPGAIFSRVEQVGPARWHVIVLLRSGDEHCDCICIT